MNGTGNRPRPRPKKRGEGVKQVTLKQAAKTYNKGKKVKTVGTEMWGKTYGVGNNTAQDTRAKEKHPDIKYGDTYGGLRPKKETSYKRPKARAYTAGGDVKDKRSPSGYSPATIRKRRVRK